jgi:hypothetical protein
MVQGENVDSGISNFQLDDCSGRDHHSLAHLSKFTLTPPERSTHSLSTGSDGQAKQ